MSDTERNELARLILENDEAGTMKPQQISAVDDLDKLPVGSVALVDGDPWQKTDVDYWQAYGDFNDGRGLLLLGSATVLHVGGTK